MKNKKSNKPAINVNNINGQSPNQFEYKTTIENQRHAALHNGEAAKHHLQAAKYYEQGNREMAAHSSMIALGHHAIAGEFLNDDAKHHAQLLKETNYK